MLRRKLEKFVRFGRLAVTGPDGSAFSVGTDDGPFVAVRIKDRTTALLLALHPDLYLGEAYMDGSLVIESGTVHDLLDLCGRNLGVQSAAVSAPRRAIEAACRRLQQLNVRAASQRNVAHHYDISGDVYRAFLDADMQYSCAYFTKPAATLDEAQLAKKAHIASKLALRPGQRVLDIGCGWGGLALYLARCEDVRVHGVTLSREQLSVCRARAEALNLAERVTFALEDYRDVGGEFDRIVSVGMFEHVGTPFYGAFFEALSRLLVPSGVALIHSIGRAGGPSYASSWVRKYIFPGAYPPSLSEVLPSIERCGLWLTDLEILRLHYAETLCQWRERFLESCHCLPSGCDERFRRMWEFYLAASEASFRHRGFMVFQAQLSPAVDSLPITRNYMAERERQLITRGPDAPDVLQAVEPDHVCDKRRAESMEGASFS